MENILSSIVFLTILLLPACKKETKEEAGSERMKLLTAGQWSLVAWTEGGTDNYSSLPLCQRDNYLIFKNDGKLEQNEGPTKCNPSLAQISSGDWRFDNGEKDIWINGGPWTIAELTISTFRIQASGFNRNEFTYKR